MVASRAKDLILPAQRTERYNLLIELCSKSPKQSNRVLVVCLQSPKSRPYWRTKFLSFSKLGPVSSEAERPAFNRVVVGSIPTPGEESESGSPIQHQAALSERSKELRLRRTGRMSAWVRTPQAAILFWMLWLYMEHAGRMGR